MTAITVWRIDAFSHCGFGWVQVTNLESGERLYFDFDPFNERCRSEGEARAQALTWIINRGGAR